MVNVEEFNQDSDRLYVDSPAGKLLVDTGSPNTILFANKLLTPEQANNLPLVERFDVMLSLTKPAYQTPVAQFDLKLHADFEVVTTIYATKLVGDGLGDAFNTYSGGAIGIVGMDIIKQCDFVWAGAGLLLIPSKSTKWVV